MSIHPLIDEITYVDKRNKEISENKLIQFETVLIDRRLTWHSARNIGQFVQGHIDSKFHAGGRSISETAIKYGGMIHNRILVLRRESRLTRVIR